MSNKGGQVPYDTAFQAAPTAADVATAGATLAVSTTGVFTIGGVKTRVSKNQYGTVTSGVAPN